MTLERITPHVELEAIRGLSWKMEMRTILLDITTASIRFERVLADAARATHVKMSAL